MFINPNARVPVEHTSDDGQTNTIYVRAKMDVDTLTRVKVEFNQINGGAERLTLGAYQLALLRHNIVGWEGPAFTDVPCTREHIGRLDPDEPLVASVLEKIDELNPPARTEDPPARANGQKKAPAGVTSNE